jgi:hypothetical protein
MDRVVNEVFLVMLRHMAFRLSISPERLVAWNRDHFASNRLTISSMLHTWSETPTSIAGVTRSV